MITILAALITGLIPATVIIVIYALQMSHRIGVLEGRSAWDYDWIKRLADQIFNSDGRNNGFLVGILSRLIPKDQIASTMQPPLKVMLKIVTTVEMHSKNKENPITKDQIRKLQDYLNKTASQLPLTRDEYQNFQSLVRNVSSDLPESQKDEFDGAAGTILRFAAGLAIVSLIK